MEIISWFKNLFVSSGSDEKDDIQDLVEDAIEQNLVIWVEVLIGCHSKDVHPGQVAWLVERMPSFDVERLNENVVEVYRLLSLIGDDRLDLVKKVRIGLGPMSDWNKDTLLRLEANLRLEREAEIKEKPLGEER